MSYPPPPYEPPPSSGQPNSGALFGPPPYSQPYGQQQYGQPYGQPQAPQQYGQQPYGAPPPGHPLPPAPRKSSPLKAVLITVGAVLAVCVGGVAVVAVATSGDKPKTGANVTVADPGVPTKAGEKPAAEKPAETGGAFNAPIGATITATEGDTVIEAALRSVKTFKKGCDSFSPDPDNGMYVVVDVVVVQKKGAGSVNPLHFEFVGGDGTEANALSGSFSGCEEPSLGAGNLRAGQKRAGKIAFDATRKAGELEWTPGGLFGEPVGSWKIT